MERRRKFAEKAAEPPGSRVRELKSRVVKTADHSLDSLPQAVLPVAFISFCGSLVMAPLIGTLRLVV